MGVAVFRPVVAVVAVMVRAGTRAVAVTKTDPTFSRGRQLAFAIIGLAHAPLTWTGLHFMALLGAQTWSAEIAATHELMLFSFTAFVAWLAFAVFKTGADVHVGPRRWEALGPWFAAWCVVQESATVFSVWRFPAEHYIGAGWWMTAFVEFGNLRVGWLALTVLVAAAAEEIVYRALLLPALEGYMSQTRALVVHAVVFELVHAFVYGRGITGIWLIGGYVLGYAFQRTRSFAVPTLLHAAHNMLVFTLAWYFNK